MRRKRDILILAVAAVLGAAASPAWAGVVVAAQGRLAGEVSLGDQGRVQVDRQSIDLRDVLVAVLDGTASAPASPGALTLVNGEVWPVEVLSLNADKVRVRSPLLGTREIQTARVAAIVLTPSAALRGKTDALYRLTGDPVPGKLLWISDTQVAIDSPLGAIALPRETVTQYLYDRPASSPLAVDEQEIRLDDGSVFRGKLVSAGETLELDHALLGKLSLPRAAVRGGRRRGAGVVLLADEKPTQAQTAPLITAGSAGEVRLTAGSVRSGTMAQQVRIEADTVVTYAMDAQTAYTLRLAVSPLENARGDAVIRIQADERVLLDRGVLARSPAAALDLEVPPARQLRIEVELGSGVRMPAGVILGDPCLIPKK